MGLLQGECASLYNRIDLLAQLVMIEQDERTVRLRCHLQGLAARFRNLVSLASDTRWPKMRRQVQFASSYVEVGTFKDWIQDPGAVENLYPHHNGVCPSEPKQAKNYSPILHQ
jgi:hypothetical protein